jgi:hypothetical protein
MAKANASIWRGGPEYYMGRGAGFPQYRILGAESQPTITAVFAPALNTLYAYPFPIGRACVLDRLMFNLTVIAGAGGVARAGIYRAFSALDIRPGPLIVDGGEFATTGAIGPRDAVVNAKLIPALYWTAIIFGVAAPTVNETGAPPNGMNDILGWQSGSPPVRNSTTATAQAYGALPAVFPLPLTFSATRNPAVWGRFSA